MIKYHDKKQLKEELILTSRRIDVNTDREGMTEKA